MATSSSLISQDTQVKRGAGVSLPPPQKGRRGKQFGALLTVQGQSDSPASKSNVAFPDSVSHASMASSDPLPGPQSDRNHTSKRRDAARLNDKGPTAPEATSTSTTQPSLVRMDETKFTILPTDGDNEAADGGDICLICAESVTYYALGACSHRTCHVCLLRMRALYKKRDCALCKTELPQVIFTTDSQTSFSSYNLSALEFKDPHLSIYCETFEQLNELLAFLKFNCPHPDCSSVLNNWKDLKFHTRSSHGLILCELCCSNKKVFAHEHTLLTPKGLHVHMNEGSVGVGKGLRRSAFRNKAQDDQDAQEDGFTGHPRCDFCATHFYDDDQLYQHCREKHEQCFICVRNGLDRWRYYLDYKHLESHFRHDHYLCPQSACLEARFMVYETALDLQAHQIEVHGAEMGMRAIRDARKLETNFTYSGGKEPQSQANNRSSREQQAGRGMMVMDIAPVRGEGSTVLSNANRIVPGLGANPEPRVDQKPDKGKCKSTSIEGRNDCPLQSPSSGLNDMGASSSKSTSDLELQRHAVLLQRVSEAVNGAESKITSFKVAIRMYRKNEMAASDFLDNICNIFEHRSETIGSILSNLLDLLDIDDDRKENLLEKWLDLKIGKSQYPSLDASANSSKRSAFGVDSTGLKLLSGSSWLRQKPKYSKLLEGPKKDSNQKVPGLATKTRKVGGQRQTAWSSTPITQPVAVRSKPVVITATAPASSHPTNTHFPSLSTKPQTFKQGWKANAAVRDPYSKTTTLNDEERAWTIKPANQPSLGTNGASSSSNGQPPTASCGKKSKKILLFTNSR